MTPEIIFCLMALLLTLFQAMRKKEKMWKMQVEKESKSVGLEKKDAMDRARWGVGVGEIAAKVG